MRSKLLISLFSSMLFLTACVDTAGLGGSTANKTPAEIALEKEARSLTQQSRDIIVRNTVQGAAVGAAVGCGLMLLMGGGADDCLVGAAAGGAIGGVGGNAAGRTAAQANKDILQRDAILGNLRNTTKRLSGVESRLNGVLRAQDSELRSLRRQLSSGQVTESAYTARARAINSNRSAVQAALQRSENNMGNTVNEINKARAGGQSGLSSLRSAATSSKSRMARARQRIKLVSVD